MTITHWTPINTRSTWNMINGLNRSFNTMLKPHTEQKTQLVDWRPAFDIRENDREYIFNADLPGLEKKDIHITVEDNVLTITGERQMISTDDQANNGFLRREINYGKFSRAFALDDKVNTEKIEAKFQNGILTLRVPRLKPVAPVATKIKIK